VLLGGVVVILLGFGGLVFVLTQVGKPDEPEDTGLANQPAGGQPAEKTEGEERVPGQSFEGKGATTETFKVGGGLTIIRLSHRGPSNFVVLYGQGQASQLLVNEVGSYDGSRALGLAPGDYSLKIDATGDWKVAVEQTTPTTADSPPQKLSGKGQAATKFFRLRPGPATFRVNHAGTGFFAPALLKADGSLVTNLANELGKFTGDKRVEIAEEGIYLVDVSANGDWTIDVSQ
jgi:hypothetical protein